MSRYQVFVRLLAVWAFSAIWCAADRAQAQGGNINVSSGPAGGIKIDAQGVVSLLAITPEDRELAIQRVRAEVAQGDRKMHTPSRLRKISLTRLEQAVASKIAAGERPTEEMLNLAGLTRLQYVFLYPDTGDVVIAGPAEGFTSDPAGHRIGTDSGRAVLQLEDVVVALRAYGPGAKGANVIQCSIDPTREGLASLQKSVSEIARSLRRPPTPDQTSAITVRLREALGLQTVTVNGVSPNTRFAKTLVEADYRMKLIGIGLDKPPVKITSYVEAANPAAVARNALKRWYFVPNYQCLRVSEDQTALELVGDGVKLVGEDEVVGAEGGRTQTGTIDAGSKKFVDSFTRAYGQLARKAPVYAELRNLIDISVAAAFMQKNDFFGKAKWNLEVFGSEKRFPVETHPVAKQVPSVCTAVWKGRTLSTPIGGGIRIEPRQGIESSNLLEDEGGKVAQKRTEINLKDLPADQWWWD